jgi:hypothetical protein
MADALRQRGVEEPGASLVAEVGIAIFRTAFDRWTREGSDEELPQLVHESLDQLKALTAGGRPLAASER